MDKALALFDPPLAYQAEIQESAGTRFGADALYNAENRRFGAMISYWTQAPEEEAMEESEEEDVEETETEESEEEEPAVTWDSVKLEIFNQYGDKIRTLQWEAPEEAGLHRTYWGFEEKGVGYVGREPRRRPRRYEPGGVDVLPGTYQLLMTYGDQSATTQITVKSDPRIEFDLEAQKAQYEAIKIMQGHREKANALIKQLVANKEVAQGYAKQLAELDKEAHQEAIKASKAMVDTIDHMLDLYFGKEDPRQGITRNSGPTVSSHLGRARSYLRSRVGGPTATEERLMGFAKDALEAYAEQVNAFFAEAWPDYREQMEAVEISPFKDYEAVEID